MDRLESQPASGALDVADRPEKPDVPMTQLRQNLLELRKQARRHDREDLTACLTLAISLATARHGN